MSRGRTVTSLHQKSWERGHGVSDHLLPRLSTSKFVIVVKVNCKSLGRELVDVGNDMESVGPKRCRHRDTVSKETDFIDRTGC